MKIVINDSYGDFGISKHFFELYQIPYIEYYGSAHATDPNFDGRKDPRLIDYIENYGSDIASGPYSKLKVVEIPKGTLYRITEYDGWESIEYNDSIGWEVAD